MLYESLGQEIEYAVCSGIWAFSFGCISEVKHANLVRLLGCCIQRKNRILIYEYLENNSLDHALKGSEKGVTTLSWSARSDICMGTAMGLSYLHEEHEPNIVHWDIKASNVLLDRNYRPKIGDFGLAKLFPDNVTHISTGVVGTTVSCVVGVKTVNAG